MDMKQLPKIKRNAMETKVLKRAQKEWIAQAKHANIPPALQEKVKAGFNKKLGKA